MQVGGLGAEESNVPAKEKSRKRKKVERGKRKKKGTNVRC
jgi:hypothetical protein